MAKITLRDIKNNQIFKFDRLKLARDFCEEYENPNDLVMSKVFYCDGSGFNGKTSAICYGLESNLKLEILNENITNNVAEYRALISCMLESGYFDIILSDSLLAVNQINGSYKVLNPHLLVLCKKCIFLMKQKKLLISWISRDINLAGIYIDKKYKRGKK